MNTFKHLLRGMRTQHKMTIARLIRIGVALTAAASLATPLWAGPFFFITGSPNGLLGALSRRPSLGVTETETADDFLLQETTVIKRATIVGLLPTGTPLDSIRDVEIEIYHVFPLDSVVPPSGNVPTRNNSPSDVEIEAATRARSVGTLTTSATVLNPNFIVANTVVNGISPKTGGEGPISGEAVEINITFTTPIILPADHYFFRPEVRLTTGDFLYLSGPRPPDSSFSPDLQAWIRNANLAPDWLRIGTDIIDGSGTAPTFNMAFSLTGETVPGVGTPGQSTCHGQSISGLAQQFGGIRAAAATLGFSSVQALQRGFGLFCE